MLLHDIRRHLVERLRLHWDIERLQGLDDRILADMGIARETIVARVKGRS
jgi:hypothetical protein